jgi:hypothetical protein
MRQVPYGLFSRLGSLACEVLVLLSPPPCSPVANGSCDSSGVDRFLLKPFGDEGSFGVATMGMVQWFEAKKNRE